MAHKSIFNWSGGKDSALALYHTLQNPDYRVDRLVTSVNNTFSRISMHGVRESLLLMQAAELGLPLQQLRMNDQPTMTEYNDTMGAMMKSLRNEGFTHSVFGDIFLEDLRRYREEKLAEQGFSAYFPIWKRNTTELVQEFIELGFKTITVCVKAELLDESFAGRIIDHEFLNDLPDGVDPCGENGEFHSFVFDGPVFKNPIPFRKGEKVFKEYRAPKDEEDNCFTDQQPRPANIGFWFCDLIPA